MSLVETTTLNNSQTPGDDDAEQVQAVFRCISVYFGELVPTGDLSFVYMTEGAANVVWKVRFENSNLQRHNGSVVLRMRKNIASTIPMVKLKEQYEERIAPLFFFDPSLLLPVHLIRLRPTVIGMLNSELLRLEDINHRREMRANVYHPTFMDEPYAMLMSNLGHGPGRVIEFKPKWLVQSPSAPRNAQRCRTCALNARRRAKGASGRGDSGFCPFDLLSSNNSILANSLKQVWNHEPTLSEFVVAFCSKVQPALRQMQKLQRSHNGIGLTDFQAPEGKDFSVAMALRDCSVLLKALESSEEKPVEISLVKVLDLDLKDSGGGKVDKWARMEAELIDEGWYTSTKDLSVKCTMTFQ